MATSSSNGYAIRQLCLVMRSHATLLFELSSQIPEVKAGIESNLAKELCLMVRCDPKPASEWQREEALNACIKWFRGELNHLQAGPIVRHLINARSTAVQAFPKLLPLIEASSKTYFETLSGDTALSTLFGVANQLYKETIKLARPEIDTIRELTKELGSLAPKLIQKVDSDIPLIPYSNRGTSHELAMKRNEKRRESEEKFVRLQKGFIERAGNLFHRILLAGAMFDDAFLISYIDDFYWKEQTSGHVEQELLDATIKNWIPHKYRGFGGSPIKYDDWDLDQHLNPISREAKALSECIRVLAEYVNKRYEFSSRTQSTQGKPSTSAKPPSSADTASSADATESKQPAEENPLNVLPNATRKAYASWKLAGQNLGLECTDKAAYAWLKEQSDDFFIGELLGYQLPSLESWSRYVRDARLVTGEQKNTSRKNRSLGGSIVSESDI